MEFSEVYSISSAYARRLKPAECGSMEYLEARVSGTFLCHPCTKASCVMLKQTVITRKYGEYKGLQEYITSIKTNSSISSVPCELHLKIHILMGSPHMNSAYLKEMKVRFI